MNRKIELWFVVVLVVCAIAITSVLVGRLNCSEHPDSWYTLGSVDIIKEAHVQEVAALKEKYEKAVLITPTDEWIELHGDDLASWQTFNIKVLVNNAQNTQGVKK